MIRPLTGDDVIKLSKCKTEDGLSIMKSMQLLPLHARVRSKSDWDEYWMMVDYVVAMDIECPVWLSFFYWIVGCGNPSLAGGPDGRILLPSFLSTGPSPEAPLPSDDVTKRSLTLAGSATRSISDSILRRDGVKEIETHVHTYHTGFASPSTTTASHSFDPTAQRHFFPFSLSLSLSATFCFDGVGDLATSKILLYGILALNAYCLFCCVACATPPPCISNESLSFSDVVPDYYPPFPTSPLLFLGAHTTPHLWAVIYFCRATGTGVSRTTITSRADSRQQPTCHLFFFSFTLFASSFVHPTTNETDAAISVRLLNWRHLGGSLSPSVLPFPISYWFASQSSSSQNNNNNNTENRKKRRSDQEFEIRGEPNSRNGWMQSSQFAVRVLALETK